MKYVLIDKEKQARFDSLYTKDEPKNKALGCSFKEALQSLGPHIRNAYKHDQMFKVEFGRLLFDPMRHPTCSTGEYEFQALIFRFEIECEYDPHDWNLYPDVKPPEGVPLCVEEHPNSVGEIRRHCLLFKNDKFIFENRLPAIGVRVKRFRPWED